MTTKHEAALRALDAAYINGTAQQGERVAEEGCDCSFGDTCSCAYDCRCRAEFRHLREEGGELINTGLRLVALEAPAPSAPPASDPDDLPCDDGPEEPWCWGPGSPEHETNQCLHNGRDE